MTANVKTNSQLSMLPSCQCPQRSVVSGQCPHVNVYIYVYRYIVMHRLLGPAVGAKYKVVTI